MNKLQTLYLYLKKVGQDQEAEELRRLIQETDEDLAWQEFRQPEPAPQQQTQTEEWKPPEGQMPQFDWLLQGNLFKKIKARREQSYLDFLDANSHILLEFNDPQYLNSGMMADTWIVDNERVLKIFDETAHTSSQQPPYKLYEQMQGYQWYDRDEDAVNVPMIYGLGRFTMPDTLKNMKGISQRQFSQQPIKLAWVLMEKVQTVGELTNRYIQDSGDDLKREIEQGDWNDEDWNVEENENFKMAEIYDIFENNYQLKEYAESQWGGELNQIEAEELIKILVQSVVSRMILDINAKVSDYNDVEFEYAEDQYDYDSEEEWNEDRLDLDDEDELRSFVENEVEMLAWDDDGEGVVTGETVELTEKILGFNRKVKFQYEEDDIGEGSSGSNFTWIIDIIMEGIRNHQAGNTDIHSGNFGFRKTKDEEGNYKNKPIYFDA